MDVPNQKLEDLRRALKEIYAERPKRGPGPGSSPLHSYVSEIKSLRNEGVSLESIALVLHKVCGLKTTKQSLSAFLKRERNRDQRLKPAQMESGLVIDQAKHTKTGQAGVLKPDQLMSQLISAEYVSSKTQESNERVGRKLRNRIEEFLLCRDVVIREDFKSKFGTYPEAKIDDLPFWQKYFDI